MSKTIKISELVPDDKNFNKGSEYGNSLIEKSFRKFGAGRSILLDKNNRIIAGNKSVENAGAIGMEDVQIVESDGKRIIAVKRTDIDLDSPEGREMALADNASAKANIVFDAELVEAELGEAVCEEWGVESSVKLEAEEDDFNGVPPKEPITVLGDLYELNEHRLHCADSCDSDAVAKLMNGKKADMVFTDPPYNVAFNGRSGKFDVIKNDDLPEDEFNNFIDGFLSVLSILNVNTYYICCNWAFYGIMQLKLKPKTCIVWAKNVFGLGRGYRHQHEFILFDGFIEASIKNESDLWQIKKDSNYIHPTQKPVEIPARALKNSTKGGNIIVDLFGGSGVTYIASDQLNRICYGQELDPKYCDVIVARYIKHKKETGSSLVIKRNGQQLSEDEINKYLENTNA
jgi:DNA modification methylase